MPYIKAIRRQEIANGGFPVTAGELNFVITQICIDYVNHTERGYQTFNDIAGALSNADKEFYERVVRPYEKQKIQENGDVF
jgi:hypothetical protein